MLIDRFGSWELPFIGSMVLMAAGVFLAFRMRPENRFDLGGATPIGDGAAQAAALVQPLR